MKAVFIDIDLTEGKKDKSKGYDTKEQLIKAFSKFLKDTGRAAAYSVCLRC